MAEPAHNVTVYYASNRTLTGPMDDPASYGPDIQPLQDVTGLVYGTAFIQGIDVPSNAQGTVASLENMQTGGFSAEAIGDVADGGRNILVFLHGFDNAFTDCVTRAGFNAAWFAASQDALADMAVMAFSWPSLGKIVSFPILQADYLHDQNMARASGLHTMTFLENLEPILTAARKNGKKAYLLAHSMGHLALQAAVETWFIKGNGTASLFDAAFLCAGDCACNAFAQPVPMQLSSLSQLVGHTNIYYSHADQVLQLSSVVNLGAQRLGQDGPLHRTDATAFPPASYTMIDATNFRGYDFNLLSSHQYYRESPDCRADIVGRL